MKRGKYYTEEQLVLLVNSEEFQQDVGNTSEILTDSNTTHVTLETDAQEGGQEGQECHLKDVFFICTNKYISFI